MLSFFRIATIDEDAVHQLLLSFGLSCSSGKSPPVPRPFALSLPARLENRGFNVAPLEYRVAGVVATVEADDNHVVFTRGFQRRFRPQRHGDRCRKSHRRYPDWSAE